MNQIVGRRAGPGLCVGGAALGMLAVLTLASCTGTIGDLPGGAPSAPPGSSTVGTSSAGTGGVTGGSSGAAMPPPKGIDPGFIPMHRLNATEYDNTINELFGLGQHLARDTFIPDEKGTTGFDNEAAALTMTAAEFQQYFSAADAIVEQVFANATLLAKVVTCQPAAATDATCLGRIINDFGLRAYRRPITPDEVTRFQKLAADAVANGEDFNGSAKQVVKMMLSSIPFLYRTEIDPTPASTEPHPVAAYELASRLSYLLWSTMPDASLFAAAQSGSLLSDATLTSEVGRMLADPRAAGFVESFAGQWLGVRELQSHQVEPTAFPAWNEPLRKAMVDEQLAFFAEFMNGDLPFTQFLTAPINFVSGPLATLYGAKNVPPSQTTPTKLVGMDPNRVGFMGLAGFLTQSSFSYRTVPTLRGKWVLENLLGEQVPAPPPGIAPLDKPAAATDSMTQEQNVRERLLAHRANPSCAACHAGLDPIGLGMENFDGIGAYRSTYGNGQPIDASGTLPGGTTFNGIVQLAAILSSVDRQQELASFAVQRLMSYALARPVSGATDTPYVAQVETAWGSQKYALRALVDDIVRNDTFRLRHGGY